MYEQIFHFSSRPFTSAPFVKHYFPGDSIHQALVQTRQSIDRAAGPVVVVGAAGMGKSLLLAMLEEQYQSQFSVANLGCVRLDRRQDLLQSLLFTLDQPHQGMTEGDLRFALIDFLKPSDKCPNGVLLLIDEAHSLPVELLDEIRLITNFVREGQPRVRLVLAGNQRLEDNLADPKLQSLNQRIAARCFLTSMSRDETKRYVVDHINRVGGNGEDLFNSDSLKAIHEVADGCPRLVNQVCEHTLMIAAANGLEQVNEQCVREAWADVQGIPGGWSPPEAPVANTDQLEGDENWTVIEFGQLDDEPAEDSVVEQSASHAEGTVYDFENAPLESQIGESAEHPLVEPEFVEPEFSSESEVSNEAENDSIGDETQDAVDQTEETVSFGQIESEWDDGNDGVESLDTLRFNSPPELESKFDQNAQWDSAPGVPVSEESTNEYEDELEAEHEDELVAEHEVELATEHEEKSAVEHEDELVTEHVQQPVPEQEEPAVQESEQVSETFGAEDAFVGEANLRPAVETVDPFDESFAAEERLIDRFAPVVAHQNQASLNVTSQDLEAIRPDSDISEEDLIRAFSGEIETSEEGESKDACDVASESSDDNAVECFAEAPENELASEEELDQVDESVAETSGANAGSTSTVLMDQLLESLRQPEERNVPPSPTVEIIESSEIPSDAPVSEEGTQAVPQNELPQTELTQNELPPNELPPNELPPSELTSPTESWQASESTYIPPGYVPLVDSVFPVEHEPSPGIQLTPVVDAAKQSAELASRSDDNHSEDVQRRAAEILERLKMSHTVSHETEPEPETVPDPEIEPELTPVAENIDPPEPATPLYESERVLQEILEQKRILAASRGPNEFGLTVATDPLDETPASNLGDQDGGKETFEDDREMIVVSRMEQRVEPESEPDPEPIPFPHTPVSTGRAERMDYQKLFDQLRDISGDEKV